MLFVKGEWYFLAIVIEPLLKLSPPSPWSSENHNLQPAGEANVIAMDSGIKVCDLPTTISDRRIWKSIVEFVSAKGHRMVIWLLWAKNKWKSG